MATRWYTDPTNTPDVSPAYDAGWDETAEAVRRKLVIDKPGNNGSVTRTDTDTVAAASSYLLWQFVSEPLDAISATLPVAKGAFRATEQNAKLNGFTRIVFRKCDEDGANPTTIATLTDDVEWDSDYPNLYNRFVGASNLADQALSQGDRLVIEVGFYSSATKAGGYIGALNVTDNHETLLDSYSTSNSDGEFLTYSAGPEVGQSFLGNGLELIGASFYLSKNSAPTGSMYAKLYAHSGTYGSTGVPGSSLATSTAISVASLTTSLAVTQFEFDGTYTLVNTTPYFIVVSYSGGDGSNYLKVGRDASSPAHAGNSARNTGSWAADSGTDVVFYVYTSGTDLGENDTDTAAYNSWIETGDTFTVASGDPPAAIKLGPMFTFA